jgi:hypothetical protein
MRAAAVLVAHLRKRPAKQTTPDDTRDKTRELTQ